MRDINDRRDIILLVDKFYEKVLHDDLIGVFFTKIKQLDWNNHIPIMYDFWESILFSTNTYHGNPMHTHFALNVKKSLEEKHFDRWLDLWQETIDENFSGEMADEAMLKARNISGIIKTKIQQSHKFNQ